MITQTTYQAIGLKRMGAYFEMHYFADYGYTSQIRGMGICQQDAMRLIREAGNQVTFDWQDDVYNWQVSFPFVNRVPFVVTEEDEEDYADTIAAFVEGTR